MSPEKDIALLKSQRACAKRALTKYETFLHNYDPERDSSIIENRMRDAEIARGAFERAQVILEAHIDDPEDAERQRTDFENKYYNTLRIATRLIAQHKLHSTQANVEENANLITPTSANNQAINLHSAVNLPKLNLPTFSGSYTSWLGFHDLFNSLVKEDTRIPPIQKLFYLKGCLKGDAADVISSIESSDDNFLVAWNLLEHRFGNKKIITQSHVKAILDFPCMSKDTPVRPLVDHMQKHMRALQSLGEPVDSWDTLLIVIIQEKLNVSVREKWEEYMSENSKPCLIDLLIVLERRAQVEDSKSYRNTISFSNSTLRKGPPQSKSKAQAPQAYVTTMSSGSCQHCKAEHSLSGCQKFKSLSPQKRYKIARKINVCINCLRGNHKVNKCTSGNCRKCDKKHHTLLHFERDIQNDTSEIIETLEASPPEAAKPESTINLHAQAYSEALLATACIDIINSKGQSMICRAFLDAGSQAHFITHQVADFLKLEKRSTNISVTGLEGIATGVKNCVTATIKSRFNNFQKTIDFLVVSQITQVTPSIKIKGSNWDIPKNICLADPEFHTPSKVDILIGVKLFYRLLCVGQIKLKNQPNAISQKTQLGWIVAGEFNNSMHSSDNVQCHITINSSPIDKSLTRFWEIEEIPSTKLLSPEEEICESHYKTNTTRSSSGSYVVRLPFNDKKGLIGDSHTMSFRRFHLLENRLAKNAKLSHEYISFLQEYESLKHMSLHSDNNKNSKGFFLPHHAVLKEDSTTTKLRVVFDGSAKSSTGISLNDSLMVGPQLQDDLFTLLIRFCSHIYALTADIEKMYRQVLVHPDDATYQKILFRANPRDSLKEYTLDTVTYGTSCAPYLAVRTLHQLADDEALHHPIASAILKKDFYVDDLLTGASTRAEASFLRDDLSQLLQKGGFHLRKWASNDPTLISSLSSDPNSMNLTLDSNSTIKTLGIQWNACEDIIFYTVNIVDDNRKITKRSILSQVAKLFDPLGLLGPVIVQAKIIIQSLWKAGLTWDESIPISIHTQWLEYRSQLPALSKLRFPRLLIGNHSKNLQLHGFCDASERAYGACFYIRSINDQNDILVKLVCSKSRVAPVTPLTIPRLELCAAVLLARLYVAIRQALSLEFQDVHLWFDSTVVLHWINTEPYLLKTFVSNRIAEIQRLTQSCHWHHTFSYDNPADLVSRGQTPTEFLPTALWQEGPAWLKTSENSWPTGALESIEIPERRAIPTPVVCMTIEFANYNLLKRYSSINKLKRIVAYIMRFLGNASSKKSTKTHGPITIKEIKNASALIIRLVQWETFAKEIHSLKNNKPINNNSRLIPLAPFLDSLHILRVGGRLQHAKLPDYQKHPILLPAKHHITQLIIREAHEALLHAGAQATLYHIRRDYWIIDGRTVIRHFIRKCLRCFRMQPRSIEYAAGNLPAERILPTRPFLNVGVDYCGPFFIKEKRLRNRNKIKAYVALYVCLATKAVHIEVVSDLTTEAFLASLKRFFSRRGKSLSIYSDNGTNFVGANNEINELQKLLSSSNHNDIVGNYLTNENITWHFIPPRAPHFGGLWEAAVKSFKRHFLRTVGDTLLTFEQLATYTSEIEAIINSRPISPLSSDPNDILPLTPGHFLIGGPLTGLPERDFSTMPSNRLSAWQHAQQLKQHFWKRWQKEYLHQLITRAKWHKNSYKDIEINTLVLIKEDNLPPQKCLLGRVSAVHPGQDGIVRVVTVKTQHGEYKRCAKKLCPLPID